MKVFQGKLPMMLLGLGGALLFSPASKAQEVNPDHYMDTGMEGVYPRSAEKAVASRVRQKSIVLVAAEKQKTDSAATLQLAADKSSSSNEQPAVPAVAEKCKRTPSTPKKQ